METKQLMLMLRTLERIVVLLIGAFTIFLGFYLFIKLPELANTQGHLELPLKIKLVWANAGPGIFFIALGTAVLIGSLSMKAKLEERPVNIPGADQPPSTSVIVSYLAATYGGVVDEQSKESARDSLQRDLRLLDQLAKFAERNTSDSVTVPTRELRSLELAASRIKAGLMFGVWDEDWGDYATFRRWLKDAEPDPPPKSIRDAIDYYYGRQGTKP